MQTSHSERPRGKCGLEPQCKWLSSHFVAVNCIAIVFFQFLRVLSTLVAREWKSTTMLTSQFLTTSSSKVQHAYLLLKKFLMDAA